MVLSKKLVIEKFGFKTSGRGQILQEYEMGKGKLATIEMMTCSGLLAKNNPHFDEFKLIEQYEDYGATIDGLFQVKVKHIDNNYCT